MVRQALLQHVAPASVHRIAGELGPEEAARRYEPLVAAGPLDLVLLGMGPDGHTASLFPGNAALDATTYVAPVFGSPKPPPQRVTLTLRALREARRVIVLASGKDKAEAVRRALAGEVPAGMIPGAEWFVTKDAAAE
jgi:6-phosphogluconolactonase